MANIIIKSEERRQHEAYVLDTFGKGYRTADSASREQAEAIAARSREAYNELRKMEGKK